MTDDAVHSLHDLERAAAAVLPMDVWDFVAGGSGNEITLAANRAALDRTYLVPRVLRDVSQCTTAGSLLGRPVSMPVGVAPIAFHRLVHPDGEVATATAARAAGVPFVVSTLSSVPLEQVTKVGGAVWLQLYWLRSRSRLFALVDAAEQTGCEALVLTVDLPWMGRRLRDLRNQFALPDGVRASLLDPAADAVAHQQSSGVSAVAGHAAQSISPTLTAADLSALRARTRLPLVVKGILAAEDAVIALECGADAIVVSNHGGRQLDGAVPGIAVLPSISAAVAGRCEILLDGGIRSGVDVLKALALGAGGVLVGRPVIWGLALDGAAGAQHVLDLLAAELHDALGLAGCSTVAAAADLGVVSAWDGYADRAGT